MMSRVQATPSSERARGIDFFVKRDGRWQTVNSQMTSIKE